MTAPLSIIALAALALHGSPMERPVGRSGQGLCPTDSPVARRMVSKFLTSTAVADLRNEWGVAGVTAANVRLLTDQQDAAVCQQLDSLVTTAAGSRRHYYFGGGFYFVAAYTEAPAGHIRLTTSPLLVLDSSLNVKGVAGT